MKSRKLPAVFLLAVLFLAPVLAGLFYGVPAAAGARDWNSLVDEVDALLSRSIALYRQGQIKPAKDLVSEAYFGPFESGQMEKAIKFGISAGRVAELEESFRTIRKQMSEEAPPAQVEQSVRRLVQDLKHDAAILSGNNGRGEPAGGLINGFAATAAHGSGPLSAPFFGTSVTSLLIILREGFEAILIIAALIAYLDKSGNPDKIGVVRSAGWAALAASLATAVMIKLAVNLSGAGQEILEGVTLLTAAAVLFAVSSWMAGQARAGGWKNQLESRLGESLSAGNLTALRLAAFLAIYREGAETALFYQALAVQGQDPYAIGIGLATGLLLLAGIFRAVRAGSRQLPLRPFFLSTGILLFLLAFVFVGQGMKELQDGGMVSVTPVPGLPGMSLIGLYPTRETVLPQITLVLLALAGLVWPRLGLSANFNKPPINHSI